MGDYRLTPDGVQARQMTKQERDTLRDSEAKLHQLRVPNLMATPQDRVFVAAMDGTGNNANRDAPENVTVVGLLREKLEILAHSAIAVGYVPGIGTQERFWSRAADGAFAMTFQPRVEQMYYEFCRQALEWQREDPDVRIHLAGIGFSRGAEAVAALQVMVDERGIRNPVGADVRYDDEGVLTSITWTDLPLLVPPAHTAQVAFLLDPVASGLMDVDRRLPGSNIGLLQFTSLQEPRDHFPVTLHAPYGLSEQGRVANLLLPGVHSDVGGAYRIDGTGRHVLNAGVDYFNRALGGELLQKVPLPLDPRMYVVHRSEQHLYGLYPDRHYARRGERLAHTGLSPECAPQTVACTRERVDYRLAERFEWHYFQPARPPGGTDRRMDDAMAALDAMHGRRTTLLDSAVAHTRVPARAQVLGTVQDTGSLFERLAESARRGDLPGMAAVTRAFVETPPGLFFKPAHVFVQAWRQAHGNASGAPGLQAADDADPGRLRPQEPAHPIPAPAMPQP